MASLQDYTIDFNAVMSDFETASADIQSYLQGKADEIDTITEYDPVSIVSTETKLTQIYRKGSPDEIDITVTGNYLGKVAGLDLTTGSIIINSILMTYNGMSFSLIASNGVTINLDTGAASVPAGTVFNMVFSTPKLYVHASGTVQLSVNSLAESFAVNAKFSDITISLPEDDYMMHLVGSVSYSQTSAGIPSFSGSLTEFKVQTPTLALAYEGTLTCKSNSLGKPSLSGQISEISLFSDDGGFAFKGNFTVNSSGVIAGKITSAQFDSAEEHFLATGINYDIGSLFNTNGGTIGDYNQDGHADLNDLKSFILNQTNLTILSAVDYSLAEDSAADNLLLTGSANISGTGNSSANIITGNTGNNILDGGAGNDTLTGSSGKDAFAFAASGNGVDTITDFTAFDVITVVGANFTSLESSTGDGTALGLNQAQLSTDGKTLYLGTDGTNGADVTIDFSSSLNSSLLSFSGETIQMKTPAPILAADTKLTFTGSGLIPGYKVQVFNNVGKSGTLAAGDTLLGTAIVDVHGNWSVTPSTAMAAGTYVILARVIDPYVFLPEMSAPLTITIATTKPSAPTSLDLSAISDTGFSSMDNLTKDNTPTITGRGTAGDMVTLFKDANNNGLKDASEASLGTAMVDGSGNWSIDSSVLPNGVNNLKAVQTDVAGNSNTSLASSALAIKVDTVAPLAPTALDLATASDTGLSTTDNVTGKNIVTITGKAEAGAHIDLYEGGTNIIGTATANTTGVWSITNSTTPLPDDVYSITAVQTDKAGNVSASSAPLAITVDSTSDVAPAAPILAADTKPTFTGSGLVPGYKVQVFNDIHKDGFDVGDTLLGTAIVDVNGNWSVTPVTTMVPGNYNILARVIDLAGNPSLISAPLTITIGAKPPVPTGLNLADISDTGSSSTDNLTADNTPTITGTGVTGNMVTLFKDTNNNGQKDASEASLGTAVVDVSSNWSIDSSILSNGVNSLKAVQTDVAGNSNTSLASSALAIKVDTVAPLAPTALDLATASDTGLSTTDNVTDKQIMTITGKAEAGATVELYSWGSSLGTSVAGTYGVWSFTTTLPGDGYYSITAVQTDKAGNVSAPSAPLAITVDTTSDGFCNTPILDFRSDTGISNMDGITNDTTPTFMGWTNPGYKVRVYNDVDKDGIIDSGDKLLGTATANRYYNWSLTPTTAMTPGDYEILASEIDLTGHISVTSAPLSFTIETTKPSAPTGLDLADISDTGSSSTDNVTYDNTPTITGTGVTGDMVTLFKDANNNGLKDASEASLGTAMVDLSGTWSIDSRGLSDGINRLKAIQMDVAGNISSASAALTITVDTTPGAAPAMPDLAASSDTGASSTDNITSDTTPTFTGSGLAAGHQVYVFDDSNNDGILDPGEQVGNTATVATNGSWSVTPLTAMAFGTHNIKATENLTDLAGNVSAASTALRLTIDTTPTLQSATINENLLTLTYDEALDGAHLPSSGYFHVQVADNGKFTYYPISTLTVDENTVTLTLSKSVAEAQTVTLSYADPTMGDDAYAVQDLAGDDAAGFTTIPVTNNTVDTSTSPFKMGFFSFTEGPNAVFTFIFTKGIQATGDAAVGWTLLRNGTNPITISSATVSGDTLTLNTTATLAPTDYVKATYSAAGSTLQDEFGNPLTDAVRLIGGSGANTLDLSNMAGYSSSWWVNTDGGNDNITGGSYVDTLIGSSGADIIDGGDGADIIYLIEGSPARDTVAIGYDGWQGGIEKIYDFDVSNAGGTNNDRLKLPSGTIAANTASPVSGTAFGELAKYSISNGILTFLNSSGQPVTISKDNIGDAERFLARNITANGTTVAFALDTDGNGSTDSLTVFQTGGIRENDALVELVGVNGVTLGNTVGQNVVNIVDTTAPEFNNVSFGGYAITMKYSENISIIDGAAYNPIYLNGTTQQLTVTKATTLNSVLTLTTNHAFVAADWILMTQAANIKDSFGNTTIPDERAAIGGSGNNTINLSSNLHSLYIYGGAGNDNLTASDSGCILEGGTGADVLNGGAGADQFRFYQGDSTAVHFLDTNYTFTFTGGVDIVNGFSGNDFIDFKVPGGITNLSEMTAPAGGLTIDQKYFMVEGSLSGATFTVGGGTDTLIVYDGDQTAGVSQTGLVIKGVTPSSLQASGNVIHL